jgi:anti-anti-sigma regulatory factor
LSNLASYVQEIFDITQLSHIFEIFATEQEALGSYQPVTAN